jgi:hypothetical protein
MVQTTCTFQVSNPCIPGVWLWNDRHEGTKDFGAKNGFMEKEHLLDHWWGDRTKRRDDLEDESESLPQARTNS